MYPVPRLASQIELEWATELAKHFSIAEAEISAKIRPWFEFPNAIVRVVLMDDSTVEMKWAFALISEEKKAIAVFSEHCGNLVLPYHEAKVFVNGRLTYEQAA